MATSAPTTRSDIRSLRDEKKKREEEQRQEKEKAASPPKRRPSIGYNPSSKPVPVQSAPLMPKETESDIRLRTGRQMDRMLEKAGAPSRLMQEVDRAGQFATGVASEIGGAVKRGYESSRQEAAQEAARKRRQKETDESRFGESGSRAARDAKALRNYDWRGAGQSLMDIGGSLLGGLSGSVPPVPRIDTRTPAERADALGKFGDEGDIRRREKARELEGDLESSREQYRPSYDKYRERAAALGIDPEDMMSLDEFAQDMMGVQAGEDGMGLEQVAPGVSPSSASSNLQTPRLNLDGEVNMPSNQGDKDNAGRVRDIVSERKKRDPDAPLSAGLQAQIKSTQVDPYTGLPMTEGSGQLVAPSLNKDGSVGAKTYTRGIPREIQDAAAKLPAAERDMYIAQSMGVDLSKYPPSQRQAAAQAFVREKEGLAERGNMVEAYTDPKTGNFVDADGNEILDENGNPRKSDVPLAYDEDGNLLSGSQAPVFIRSEAALKRGDQRKKYSSVMQRAESIAGNKSVSQFLTVDPDTGAESLDVAAFEQRFPGSLPPEGDPQRADAIEKLTSMALRGKAVKQNNDRLGRVQQFASPTFGPMLMMESLQQAKTPEEKIAIANYFNRPDLVALYQEQAMGDRGILKAEKEAEAAAAMRAAGKTEVNMESPSGVAGESQKAIRQGVDAGDLRPVIAALSSGPSPMMKEEEVRDGAMSYEAQTAGAAVFNSPIHQPRVQGLFKAATDGWTFVERWSDDQIEDSRQKFMSSAAEAAGLPLVDEEGNPTETSAVLSRIFENMWTQLYGDRRRLPRPKRNTETKGVGLPDDEVESGTVPPPGPVPQASARP